MQNKDRSVEYMDCVTYFNMGIIMMDCMTNPSLGCSNPHGTLPMIQFIKCTYILHSNNH